MRHFALLILLLLAACDGTIENDFNEEVVVESYQFTGAPFSPVFVFTTAPVGEPFDRTALSINDADVRVLLLAPSGDAVEQAFTFSRDPISAGTYRADDADHRVLPLRRYRVEIDAPGRPLVSSVTLTPGAFELRGVSTSEATWGAEEIEYTFTRPEYPTRQAVFIFTTETQRDRLSIDLATPFFRAIFNSQEDDEPNPLGPEDVRVGSSPPINEANYDLNPVDGTLLIDLPWIAVPFYGPSKVSASSLDDNLFDFLRSQAVQQGGTTLSPGEIPNVLDRVDGGVGVFGSLSRVTMDVFVRCETARNFGDACPADS